MKIGFIGAGKVGISFGIYLTRKGFQIYGYYSRTFESARNAADRTGSKAVEDMGVLVKNSDVIFITTGDDEISKVCSNLAEKNLLTKGKIVVHMSGALSSRILHSAIERGCCVYSLHPLQAFADVEKASLDLNNTVFSIEGDLERMDIMESILEKTGNPYYKLTQQQKGIYHAAACVLSNYMVTLMDYGLSLYKSIGIDGQDALNAVRPLIQGTLDNVMELGPEGALTGPIARGDIQTVKSHVEALKKYSPESLEFYKQMALMTVELAKKRKLNDKNKEDALKNLLEEV